MPASARWPNTASSSGSTLERAVRVAAHHHAADARAVLHPLRPRRPRPRRRGSGSSARPANRSGAYATYSDEPVVVRAHEREVEVGIGVGDDRLAEPRRRDRAPRRRRRPGPSLEPRRGVVAAAADLVEPLPPVISSGGKPGARVHPEVDRVGDALEHPRVALRRTTRCEARGRGTSTAPVPSTGRPARSRGCRPRSAGTCERPYPPRLGLTASRHSRERAAVRKPDARPVRSLLYTPGDQEHRIAENVKSGADALFLDLEEPRTPCPEATRVRARELVREFLDTAPAGAGSTDLLRTRATGRVGDDPARPARGDVRPNSPACCCPRSPVRPTCTPPTRSSAASRSSTASPSGSTMLYPILENAYAIRNAYEIAMASDRVAYMGGAVSRFGDIVADIGFRWTRARHRDAVHPREGVDRRASPRASAIRSAACGVARTTISTGCARG